MVEEVKSSVYKAVKDPKTGKCILKKKRRAPPKKDKAKKESSLEKKVDLIVDTLVPKKESNEEKRRRHFTAQNLAEEQVAKAIEKEKSSLKTKITGRPTQSTPKTSSVGTQASPKKTSTTSTGTQAEIVPDDSIIAAIDSVRFNLQVNEQDKLNTEAEIQDRNLGPAKGKAVKIKGLQTKLAKLEKSDETLKETLTKLTADLAARDSQGGQGGDIDDGLFDSEIEKIMKSVKGFKGVIPSDKVSTIDCTDKCSFIMNLDNSKEPGSHWVAVYIDLDKDKEVDYYDSFGRPPTASFVKDITTLVEKLKPPHMLKFKVNTVVNQKATTGTCGFMAINFIKARNSGQTFKEATSYTIGEGEKRAEKEGAKFGYI